jgi:hypothetical protein
MKLRGPVVSALVLLLIVSSSLGCDWDYLIWIPRSPTADPMYRFARNGKTGYIDQTGKVVIAPTILEAGGNYGREFHDGLVEIGFNDGVYLDMHGKKVIHEGLYRGWDFSEGLAVAMKKDGGKWGYINTRGEFAISPRFASASNDYVSSFEGGFARIEVAGKFGFIDHTGNFVIPPKFLDSDSFHEGMARVIVEGPCIYSRIREESPCGDLGVAPQGTKAQEFLPPCKYTFIDTSGNVISDVRYDYASRFAEGLAPVRVGKLWGYINKKGEVAIAPRFENASPFSDGLGLVTENGLFGYIDRAGAYAITPQFKYAESFAEGRAVVSDDIDDSKYWYIDTAGHPAFEGEFFRASSFFKGLAHVEFLADVRGTESDGSGTFAYINVAGKPVFSYRP